MTSLCQYRLSASFENSVCFRACSQRAFRQTYVSVSVIFAPSDWILANIDCCVPLFGANLPLSEYIYLKIILLTWQGFHSLILPADWLITFPSLITVSVGMLKTLNF